MNAKRKDRNELATLIGGLFALGICLILLLCIGAARASDRGVPIKVVVNSFVLDVRKILTPGETSLRQ